MFSNEYLQTLDDDSIKIYNGEIRTIQENPVLFLEEQR